MRFSLYEIFHKKDIVQSGKVCRNKYLPSIVTKAVGRDTGTWGLCCAEV